VTHKCIPHGLAKILTRTTAVTGQLNRLNHGTARPGGRFFICWCWVRL